MKKKICLLLATCLLCCSLCGCENQSSTSLSDAVESSPQSSPAERLQDTDAAPADSEVLDLTALSSTMVYAEVYNMMVTPENYVGRTVKMQGQFTVYEDTENNKVYYACVIADATACCQQGLEFVLSGNVTYPDDYPEPNTEITVTGVFQTYEESGYKYCHLVDAEFSN